MFSLENETDTHYTIKHSKGDVLKIAKKGLSHDMHASIQKMSRGGVAKYAEGTGPEGVEQSDAAPIEAPPQAQPPVTININSDKGVSQPQGAPEQQAPKPQVPINAGQPQGQATEYPQAPLANIPPGTNLHDLPNLSNQLQNNIGLITKGAEQEAATKASVGNEQANLLHQQAVNEYKYNQMVSRNAQEESTQLESIASELNNKQLDFNKIWHDKSTPHKITAGIGMLLSGIGSGLTGQPNLAIKMINDEIERDMKSQLANQENKRTAFGMYEKVYGNKEHALMAQKLGYQAAVATQIQSMIAKNAGPMADAQKNLFLGQVLAPLQRGVYDLALQRANYQFMTSGQGGAPGNQNTGSGQSGNMPANYVPQGNEEDKLLKGDSESIMPENLGRTGAVDLKKLNGLQMLGWLPKEDKEAATKEAKEFQEAQTNKSLILKDLSDMSNAVVENKTHKFMDPLGSLKGQHMLSKLPFETGKLFGEMEPWGGEISRKFAAAKGSALNKINTLLTKRIGGEGMKNIEIQLPDRSDTPQEIKEKIQRIMTLIDANSATPTLDRYGLIRR